MNKKDMFIKEKLQQDKKISNKANEIFEHVKEEFDMENNGKKSIKISLNKFLAIAASLVIVGFLGIGLYATKFKKNDVIAEKEKNTETTETQKAFKYALKSNSLEDFDLRFLQLENTKVNKIYSPLSIKYTLAMLNEGTEGESKEQISKLIGEYKSNKYVNSKNMSFANALFIRDTYEPSIKQTFIDNLRNKYNADVIYDSFSSAKNMNSWISDKTLELINDMVNDSDLSDLDYALVNALAIDMEWKHKFISTEENVGIIDYQTNYRHENYGWSAPTQLISNKFEGVQGDISGMGIVASINNYDIVKTLGEENIRKTVGDRLREYLKENPDRTSDFGYFNSKDEWVRLEGADTETIVKHYLDDYIEELNASYKTVDRNTDFEIYQNEKVTAFAKDLKEYNGTTLQYVAIMPEEELDSYINNITAQDISNIISNLKQITNENFKEGVITQITGYIPKFKFDYNLNLIEDLNDMGVKDVFDSEKASLKGITDDEGAYIAKAVHKANIEFTQDGIKASAATMGGGAGAGSMFDYIYDVPVEKITLDFTKPYMFIIRDKATGEVWFAGTVYKPLSLEDEPEVGNPNNYQIGSYSEYLKTDVNYNYIPCGDVNCDGEVNKLDHTYLQGYLEGQEGYDLTEQEKKYADVNKDGEVNKTDVDIINKYIDGTYESLQVK